MKLVIKNSKIGGKGTFAVEALKKGQLIRKLTGEVVSREEINRRIARGQERNDDPLDIGDNLFLDLDKKSLLINHSCNPNAAIINTSDLVAIKDIKCGEEITFDYSMTAGKYDEWNMDCNCGAKNCRRRIGNILTVPKNLLKKYYQNGWLQDFTKNQVQNFIAE